MFNAVDTDVELSVWALLLLVRLHTVVIDNMRARPAFINPHRGVPCNAHHWTQHVRFALVPRIAILFLSLYACAEAPRATRQAHQTGRTRINYRRAGAHAGLRVTLDE